MKTMHLFAVCHVILTLNLTKGCFCYFKPKLGKKARIEIVEVDDDEDEDDYEE